MQRKTTHAMQHPKTRKPTERPGFISRFATGTKGLVSVLGAGALLAPVDKAESATVLTGINQFGSSANIGYAFINDDDGATYNSATLDLSAVLGSVVDAIVANNPNYSTNAQVYGAMGFGITNTGDVSGGWSGTINPTNGILSIENNGFAYTVWSHPRTMTGTLNLGNMLDYNGNGIIDPNETLAFMGIANNAFNAYSETGLTNWNTDAQRIGVIPEPSTALLGGLGALGLAMRRKRTDKVETKYD